MSLDFKSIPQTSELYNIKLPFLQEVQQRIAAGEQAEYSDIAIALFNERFDLYTYLCSYLQQTIPKEEIVCKISELENLAHECDYAVNVSWLYKAIAWNEAWNAKQRDIIEWTAEIANVNTKLSACEVEALVKQCKTSCNKVNSGELYKLAALHGNAEAMFNYANENNVSHGLREYLTLESAKKGYAPAQVAVAFDLLLPNRESENHEALMWLKKAAEQLNPEAFKWLAHIYKHGASGISKNQKLADHFRLKAVEYGTKDKDILKWMAQIYEYGSESLQIASSPQKAVEYWILVDDEDCRLKLAKAFLTGFGVDVSKEKALSLLKKIECVTSNTQTLAVIIEIYDSLKLKTWRIRAAQKALDLWNEKKKQMVHHPSSIDSLLNLMNYEDDYETCKGNIDRNIKHYQEIIKSDQI